MTTPSEQPEEQQEQEPITLEVQDGHLGGSAEFSTEEDK